MSDVSESPRGAAPERHDPRRFATTQWSRVLVAGDSQDPARHDALADLCQRYWFPVYAFLRRRGTPAEAAQDLTQGFFCHVLEKGTLKAADRGRGRFRSYLLGALKFYLADEHDRASAQKRGGAVTTVSLDLEAAEARYTPEPDRQDDPDHLFVRRWALEVLEQAHARLRAHLDKTGDPERSRRLAGFLTDSENRRYREVAAELQMSESAVKVAVHRLRRRFGAVLREEVARTVADPSRVDDELRFLLAAISR